MSKPWGHGVLTMYKVDKSEWIIILVTFVSFAILIYFETGSFVIVIIVSFLAMALMCPLAFVLEKIMRKIGIKTRNKD